MASRRPSIALLVLSALLLLSSVPAADAQSTDQRQFVEHDVPAEASADDAVQARAAAIAKGQVTALERLLVRLTGANPSRVPTVPEDQIDQYVRSFEIQQEQVGARTYSAELTVTFRPEPVQELLRSNGLSYGIVEVLPTVLLAYGPDGDPFLEGDPWRDAVIEAAGRSAAVEPVLPLGDAQDLAIPQAAAQAGDQGTLQPVADRYAAKAVLVAQAALRPQADGSQGLTVQGQYLGQDGSVRALPAQEVPPTAEGLPDYEIAARSLLDSLDRQVGQSVVRSDAIVELLTVSVPLADLGAWVQIRRALAETPEIRTTKVQRFSRREAQVVLGHVGSVEDVRVALARRGLDLSQEIEGWRLRRAGDPPVSTIGG